MDVDVELLIPGVQCREDSGPSAEELWIGEQLRERLRCGGEERVGELAFVVTPQLVELMWDGEDDVMMGHAEQSLLPSIEPFFAWQPSTLGATAVQAGVVCDLVIMPFGATVDVAAHLACSAMNNAPSSVTHIIGQLPR
jgi:hypothetical protein